AVRAMGSTKARQPSLVRRGGITVAIVAALALATAVGWLAAGSREPANRKPMVVIGDGFTTPQNMAWIPGGEFRMGSEHALAAANERPAHRVRVKGFWMDITHVTNDEFGEF